MPASDTARQVTTDAELSLPVTMRETLTSLSSCDSPVLARLSPDGGGAAKERAPLLLVWLCYEYQCSMAV
jgi:hypothetical protein